MSPKLVVNKFEAGKDVQSMIITFYDDIVKIDDGENDLLNSLNGSTKKTIRGPWVTGMTSPLENYRTHALIVKEVGLDETGEFDLDSITHKIIPQKSSSEPNPDRSENSSRDDVSEQENEITDASQIDGDFVVLQKENNTKEKPKLKVDELCKLLATKTTMKQTSANIRRMNVDLLNDVLCKTQENNANIKYNISNLNKLLEYTKKEEEKSKQLNAAANVCEKCGATINSRFQDHECEDIAEISGTDDFYLILAKEGEEQTNETQNHNGAHFDKKELHLPQGEMCITSADLYSYKHEGHTHFLCYVCGQTSETAKSHEEHIAGHENYNY